MLGRGSMVNI